MPAADNFKWSDVAIPLEDPCPYTAVGLFSGAVQGVRYAAKSANVLLNLGSTNFRFISRWTCWLTSSDNTVRCLGVGFLQGIGLLYFKFLACRLWKIRKGSDHWEPFLPQWYRVINYIVLPYGKLWERYPATASTIPRDVNSGVNWRKKSILQRLLRESRWYIRCRIPSRPWKERCSLLGVRRMKCFGEKCLTTGPVSMKGVFQDGGLTIEICLALVLRMRFPYQCGEHRIMLGPSRRQLELAARSTYFLTRRKIFERDMTRRPVSWGSL